MLAIPRLFWKKMRRVMLFCFAEAFPEEATGTLRQPSTVEGDFTVVIEG